MTPDVHISFRNMDRSPAAAGRIAAEVGKLGRYCQDISSCRVVMQALHRHRRFGHHYQVHIDLRVPGREISVSHEPDLRPTLSGAGGTIPAKRSEVGAVDKDPYVVIRDAFDVARRRLEDGLRRNRRRRRP